MTGSAQTRPLPAKLWATSGTRLAETRAEVRPRVAHIGRKWAKRVRKIGARIARIGSGSEFHERLCLGLGVCSEVDTLGLGLVWGRDRFVAPNIGSAKVRAECAESRQTPSLERPVVRTKSASAPGSRLRAGGPGRHTERTSPEGGGEEAGVSMCPDLMPRDAWAPRDPQNQLPRAETFRLHRVESTARPRGREATQTHNPLETLSHRDEEPRPMARCLAQRSIARAKRRKNTRRLRCSRLR